MSNREKLQQIRKDVVHILNQIDGLLGQTPSYGQVQPTEQKFEGDPVAQRLSDLVTTRQLGDDTSSLSRKVS